MAILYATVGEDYEDSHLEGAQCRHPKYDARGHICGERKPL